MIIAFRVKSIAPYILMILALLSIRILFDELVALSLNSR